MKYPARSVDQTLYHAKDDGKLTFDPYWSKFCCPVCDTVWKLQILERMSPTDLAQRFYVIVEVTDTDDVLVEKEEGGTRFLATVPRAEAHKYHRANIDLGGPKKN